MAVIVSLSTIPARFTHIGATLHSLIAQTAPIDEIRLYIPRKYRRFPDYDGSLPDVPKGVRIIQPSDDLGPASKVLFAVDDLRGTDTTIIYCDDDRIYETDRFARMMAESLQRPKMCIAPWTFDLDRFGITVQAQRQPRPTPFRKDWTYRLTRIRHQLRYLATSKTTPKPVIPRLGRGGFRDIAEGFGAVLVRPDFFDGDCFDIPPVLWSVDDIWLSGQLERRDIPIWTPPAYVAPPETGNHLQAPLFQAVIDGADREQANIACVRYMQDTYGIWR